MSSKPINQHKFVFVALAFILLPSMAIGSIVLAQTPLTNPEVVKTLAGQDISYWLIALATVCISSWTFVVKWGLNQLENQRSSNATLVTQLVTYMKEDHATALVVMEKVTGVMERLVSHLDKQERREEIDKALHGGVSAPSKQ